MVTLLNLGSSLQGTFRQNSGGYFFTQTLVLFKYSFVILMFFFLFKYILASLFIHSTFEYSTGHTLWHNQFMFYLSRDREEDVFLLYFRMSICFHIS